MIHQSTNNLITNTFNKLNTFSATFVKTPLIVSAIPLITLLVIHGIASDNSFTGVSIAACAIVPAISAADGLPVAASHVL